MCVLSVDNTLVFVYESMRITKYAHPGSNRTGNKIAPERKMVHALHPIHWVEEAVGKRRCIDACYVRAVVN